MPHFGLHQEDSQERASFVFISYSHANNTVVNRLKEDLQANGISLWLDHESIEPGTPDWGKAIERGIASCQALIYVASPEAKRSSYVVNELEIAKHHNLPILPFWVEGEYWLDVAPFGMARIQYIDARSNYLPAFQILLRRLNELFKKTSEDRTNQQGSRGKSSTIEDMLLPLTEKQECVWADAWQDGWEARRLELEYDEAMPASRFADDIGQLPREMRQMLDDWRREHSKEYQTYSHEPAGVRVRLEHVRHQSHPSRKCFITLSPSKFLYYVAIQQRLGEPKYKSIRKKYFHHAMNLRSGETLELPSLFSLHMAVVSRDGFLLLRRRRMDEDTLYPGAWEAGLGELMHGKKPIPGKEEEVLHPCFTDDGKPDVFLFLTSAIHEELERKDDRYIEPRPEHFCLYGFAVEYQTLAPKLLVVYRSDHDIKELRTRAKDADDPALAWDERPLSPEGIQSACSKYSYWGPTSKLVMLLALKQDYELQQMFDEAADVGVLVDKFIPDPGHKPEDLWENQESSWLSHLRKRFRF